MAGALFGFLGQVSEAMQLPVCTSVEGGEQLLEKRVVCRRAVVAEDGVGDKVGELNQSSRLAVNEERYLGDVRESPEAGSGLPPRLGERLECLLVFRLIGDDQAELATSGLAEKGREPKKKLLEDALKRIGVTYSARLSRNCKEAPTWLTLAHESHQVSCDGVPDMARNSPPTATTTENLSRMQLKTVEVRVEVLCDDGLYLSAHVVDLTRVNREPSNDERLGVVVRTATFVQVKKEHSGQKKAAEASPKRSASRSRRQLSQP